MATTGIDKLRHLIKVRRPQKLSDPYFDFSEEHLKKLLATPDEEYDGVDYRLLFGPHLPAGTYSELVYFIPLAFDYFAHPDDHDDIPEMSLALIGFTADERENLERDGLFEPIRQCFQECFERWTATFTVTHYDKKACTAMGWGLDSYDFVRGLEFIYDIIDTMLKYNLFPEVVSGVIQQLAHNTSDPIKAAWFLAYAAGEYREDIKASRMFPIKFEPIESVILDHDLLNNAAGLVRRDSTLYRMSETYWIDTFDILGLDDYL